MNPSSDEVDSLISFLKIIDLFKYVIPKLGGSKIEINLFLLILD